MIRVGIYPKDEFPGRDYFDLIKISDLSDVADMEIQVLFVHPSHTPSEKNFWEEILKYAKTNPRTSFLIHSPANEQEHLKRILGEGKNINYLGGEEYFLRQRQLISVKK